MPAVRALGCRLVIRRAAEGRVHSTQTGECPSARPVPGLQARVGLRSGQPVGGPQADPVRRMMGAKTFFYFHLAIAEPVSTVVAVAQLAREARVRALVGIAIGLCASGLGYCTT